MNRTELTRIAKFMLLVGFCMLGAMLPQAKADAFNQKILFTFSGPVEIPGQVLQAGTYVFKVLDTMGTRDIVQVFNKDEDKVYGTFITVGDYRLKPTDKGVLTFGERPAGSPEAVKAWFYPGRNYGHEFVYPKKKAVELAKTYNTPVPSMPDELTADTTKPAATRNEQSVQELEHAPLKAEKPTDEEVEVAELFETPPPVASLPKKLPKTASELPLIGLIGLLSLGMAVSLRFAAAKAK